MECQQLKTENNNDEKITDIDMFVKKFKIHADHEYIKMIRKEMIEGRIIYDTNYWDKYLSWTKQNI